MSLKAIKRPNLMAAVPKRDLKCVAKTMIEYKDVFL